jgi:hypothetical protein
MQPLQTGKMERELFYTYLQDTNRLNDKTLEEMKELTEEFPWFQVGWMLYLKNLKNINSPEFNTVLKKVAVMVPDRKNLFRFLNSDLPKRQLSIENLKAASSLYQLEGQVEPQNNKSLIDKFLSTESGSVRIKNEGTDGSVNLNNREFLQKSVAENDELITETLAAIYFQQKNYNKAQQAYQKLSLKYPEKSVYFAARIKEIEVLKNNN